MWKAKELGLSPPIFVGKKVLQTLLHRAHQGISSQLLKLWKVAPWHKGFEHYSTQLSLRILADGLRHTYNLPRYAGGIQTHFQYCWCYILHPHYITIQIPIRPMNQETIICWIYTNRLNRLFIYIYISYPIATVFVYTPSMIRFFPSILVNFTLQKIHHNPQLPQEKRFRRAPFTWRWIPPTAREPWWTWTLAW